MDKFALLALLCSCSVFICIAVAEEIPAAAEPAVVAATTAAPADPEPATTISLAKVRLAELQAKAKRRREEQQAKAKQRRDERKAKADEFQEKYRKWLALPQKERLPALKKYLADRRKENKAKIACRRAKALGKECATEAPIQATTAAVGQENAVNEAATAAPVVEQSTNIAAEQTSAPAVDVAENQPASEIQQSNQGQQAAH